MESDAAGGERSPYDSIWVNYLNVLSVFFALMGCGALVLTQGWRDDYHLSVVAGIAGAALMSGVLLRRDGYPYTDGQGEPAPAKPRFSRTSPRMLLAIPIVALLIDLNVVALAPDAQIDLGYAFLLIAASVFAGLALDSVESTLEYAIAGLTGLVLDNAIQVNLSDDRFWTYPLLFLSYFLPMSAAFVLLPLVLKRHPTGLLDAGLLSILWAVIGQQEWGGQAVDPWSPHLLLVVAGLVACRILYGLLRRSARAT